MALYPRAGFREIRRNENGSGYVKRPESRRGVLSWAQRWTKAALPWE